MGFASDIWIQNKQAFMAVEERFIRISVRLKRMLCYAMLSVVLNSTSMYQNNEIVKIGIITKVITPNLMTPLPMRRLNI